MCVFIYAWIEYWRDFLRLLKWEETSPRPERERFFRFSTRKLMARNRSVLLSPSSSATVKPRQKISLALTLSFSKIFTLAFFFFSGKNKNCLTTHAFGFCARRLLHARYIKREREITLAWIRRLNENGPQRKLPARSNSRWEGFKVGINSKTRERERGVLLLRIQKFKRETRNKRRALIIIKRKVTWSKWD